MDIYKTRVQCPRSLITTKFKPRSKGKLTAYLHIQYDDSFPQLPIAGNNDNSVLKVGSPQIPGKWQILIGNI